ncbi:hypothetical protein ACF090_13265 [Streptomyces sp. NPDC014892]|uniref:hypothetical protein n=1 Tax=Streptomyces sp. NPDC014892 TaxID=3364930 RepID=UPI0036FED0E5
MARMPHPPDTARTDGEVVPRPPDWSRAKVGNPAPCISCGRPALLRHPDTGRPHHRNCDEPAASAPAQQQAAAIQPCRFCLNPASLTGPEGKPEHWSCRRKAGVR